MAPLPLSDRSRKVSTAHRGARASTGRQRPPTHQAGPRVASEGEVTARWRLRDSAVDREEPPLHRAAAPVHVPDRDVPDGAARGTNRSGLA